jgi:leader peptidase (prepilin peptidase) / N-methyltransferase
VTDDYGVLLSAPERASASARLVAILLIVDWFITAAFLLFGLLFGSFLNVCIYRLPRARSVVTPGSACPACGTPIKFYDNVPVLSWLILRGKCRQCGVHITGRYALVELLTGAMFAACYLGAIWISNVATIDDTFHLLVAIKACVLSFLIVGLIFTDYETRLLPDAMTLPGLGVGLAFSLFVPLLDLVSFGVPWFFQVHPSWRLLSLGDALLGAAVGGGFLWAVRAGFFLARGYEGMGMGDVKLMAMIGAFLGMRITLVSIFAASVLGVLIGVGVAPYLYAKKKRYWLARRRPEAVARERAKRAAFRNRLPFGVFLGLAALLLMFFGHQLLAWYWQQFA